MTFEQWMQKVDSAVIRQTGVSVHDLADQCFHDWFDDGITPVQAARLTLENEGF
jgi:hypothetical protein